MTVFETSRLTILCAVKMQKYTVIRMFNFGQDEKHSKRQVWTASESLRIIYTSDFAMRFGFINTENATEYEIGDWCVT
jgi:hypothetical protein